MKKALYFTNITNEDFTYAYDSQEMTFKVGESRLMEFGVASHFARHLAVRELHKEDKSGGRETVEKLAATYMSVDAVEAKTDSELETKILNANVAEKKKEAKKAEPKKKEDKKEEEFEDLK